MIKKILILLVCMVWMTSLVSAAWWYGTQPNAYFKLNEGDGDTAIDSGITAANGANVNKAMFETGKLNNGSTFNNSVTDQGYFNVGAFNDLGRASFTIAVWFNHSGDFSGGNAAYIVCKNKLVVGEGEWCLRVRTDGKVQWSGDPDGDPLTTIISTNTFVDGSFHRAVLTRDNTTGVDSMNLYVDNNLEATAQIPTTYNYNNTQDFQIGRADGGIPVYYHNGMIDDLQLYYSAWGVADIAEDWNAGVGKEGDVAGGAATTADNNATFSNHSYETSVETIILNITYNDTVWPNDRARLNYNGTWYDTFPFSLDENRHYAGYPHVPLVTSATEMIFYYEVVLSHPNGTSFIFYPGIDGTTFWWNQTVNQTHLAQCNGLDTRTVNYTIYDEVLGTELVADLDVTFDWMLNQSSSYTATNSSSLTGKASYEFCLAPNLTHYTDVTINLDADGYNARLYSFANVEFNQTSQSIPLYLLNESAGTEVSITVLDRGKAPLADYTVKIYRFDTGTGLYSLVKEAITGNHGQIIAVLEESNVKYRVEIYDADGILQKRHDNFVVYCPAALCRYEFIIGEEADWYEGFDDVSGVNYTLSFNNETNVVTFAWTDTSPESTFYRFRVTKLSLNGTIIAGEINDTSKTDSRGIDLSSYGDGVYKAEVYRTLNGVETRIDVLPVQIGTNYQTFGREGLFLAFILLFTLILVGLFSPQVGVLLYLSGLIVLWATNIIHIDIIVLVTNIVIGGIIIYLYRT